MRVTNLYEGNKPVVSFEFFPPRTEKAAESFGSTIDDLAGLEPDYMSITFGAGGSTRERTHATVARMLSETTLTPAAHLTCVAASRGEVTRPKEHAVLYRVTEFVGRWSMVDVFVVAILVALIQIGGLLSIRPGIAALAFCGVVIVTMIAAESFDPRLIWDQLGEDNE